MNMKRLAAGCVVLGLVAFSTPILAQTYAADVAAVSAGCAGSAAACDGVVGVELARVGAAGLTPAEVNAQLGAIAGAAITAAASLPATERAKLAVIMRAIAAASTNPEQASALQALASNLASGADVNLVAVASSLSAS